jgi:hypothetical protein
MFLIGVTYALSGCRFEVLCGFVNAIFLMVIASFIFLEALGRVSIHVYMHVCNAVYMCNGVLVEALWRVCISMCVYVCNAVCICKVFFF